MRVVFASIAALSALLLVDVFAGTATADDADDPDIDVRADSESAVARYQLTPKTRLIVIAANLRSVTGDNQYFADVVIEEEPGCRPDCLIPDIMIFRASATFDSPQLRGGVNRARLDVTLPVLGCALSSCPTSIHVDLVWKPDGRPFRDTTTTHIDTGDCEVKKVTRLAVTLAKVSGSVGDGTNTLASGDASGNVVQQRIRVVGSGDPAVCL